MMKTEEYSYFLARLPIGLAFFGHGIVKLPKLETFSHELAALFSRTVLPNALVAAFGYVLPVLNLLIGLLLILGLFTRSAILLGFILILILIFGSSLIEHWNNVFIQLIYGAYLIILYRYLSFNKASFDYAFR